MLQSFPGPNREPAGAMQFQFHASFPLVVGHLEEIDLRHRAGNVEKRVDSAKAVKSVVDERL